MSQPALPRRKGRLIFLGKLLFSGLLLTILFLRADRAVFLRTLQALPLQLFLGCVGLYFLGYVIRDRKSVV